MKTKKKCSTCSNYFEAKRSDALYCSNACKQKAHYQNKKTNPQPDSPSYTFNYNEYESVLKEIRLNYEDLPFLIYCYQRKNLSDSFDIKGIANFVSSLWLENHDIIKLKSFLEFQEDFFSGKFTITAN